MRLTLLRLRSFSSVFGLNNISLIFPLLLFNNKIFASPFLKGKEIDSFSFIGIKNFSENNLILSTSIYPYSSIISISLSLGFNK